MILITGKKYIFKVPNVSETEAHAFHIHMFGKDDDSEKRATEARISWELVGEFNAYKPRDVITREDPWLPAGTEVDVSKYFDILLSTNQGAYGIAPDWVVGPYTES